VGVGVCFRGLGVGVGFRVGVGFLVGVGLGVGLRVAAGVGVGALVGLAHAAGLKASRPLQIPSESSAITAVPRNHLTRAPPIGLSAEVYEPTPLLANVKAE